MLLRAGNCRPVRDVRKLNRRGRSFYSVAAPEATSTSRNRTGPHSMARKTPQPGFQDRLASLRTAEFDVQEVAGAPGHVKISKHGCTAILTTAENGAVAF